MILYLSNYVQYEGLVVPTVVHSCCKIKAKDNHEQLEKQSKVINNKKTLNISHLN